ncbi:concanavalin A-like lectin/glucanase domain-containing protein, partial [Tribonema minus]
GVALSRTDCAPQLMLSKDQLTVTGEKGFRMVRATAGASEGAWYFEVLVLPPARADGHVRIGWSTGAGDLQAPVGYDRHSYAYRDLAGSRVHASLRHDGYGAPYGPGDVVGAQIVLAGPSDPSGAPTSAIRFFVNGVDQGVAYTALAPAAYLPAVSLYMGARVRVNFGPRFVCAPPPLRAE